MGPGVRPDAVAPVLASRRPSLDAVCTRDREMVLDYNRIKVGKAFGFILRSLSKKRVPQVLSFFTAEW